MIQLGTNYHGNCVSNRPNFSLVFQKYIITILRKIHVIIFYASCMSLKLTFHISVIASQEACIFGSLWSVMEGRRAERRSGEKGRPRTQAKKKGALVFSQRNQKKSMIDRRNQTINMFALKTFRARIVCVLPGRPLGFVSTSPTDKYAQVEKRQLRT